MKKVAIIGAGLTGLSLAYFLKKKDIPFVIYEKSERTGGVIKSEKKEGFVIEKGPNTGVIANLALAELLEELADIAPAIYAAESAKKRLIWKNSEWQALPSDIKTAISTPLFTWKDKLKVAGEFFRKKGNFEKESLAKTVQRRLGKSFLDYAIDPFVSGVYAGDPEYLVTKYAFKKLYDLEDKYGSFMKGSIKLSKERSTEYKKKVNKKIFSFEKGLQEFTDALTTKIGKKNILLNSKNINIQFLSPHNFLVNGESFSHVISTVNAGEIENLFPFISADKINPIKNLKYAPVVEISLGFKEWKGMNIDAFGGMIPSKEKKNLLGILFMSSQFPRRAPKGGAFFSVFMGGIKKPEIVKLPDDQIIKLLEKDFIQLMKIPEFSPDLLEISYHPNAIAQYGIDSKKRLQSIDQIEILFPGLLLKGNIKEGVGIADRVEQASKTLNQIISV